MGSRIMKSFRNCWLLVFPKFKVRSVTFIYAVILLIVFIITDIVYAVNKRTTSWSCTLYNFGAKYTYAISRRGHIHRLILPLILHSSFLHLFWNVFSLFMIGFSIEEACKTWYRYLALLLIGGVGGNIISATIKPYDVAVGASTALFAVIGALIYWFIYNWSLLGPMRL